jgi:hypothetical protein
MIIIVSLSFRHCSSFLFDRCVFSQTEGQEYGAAEEKDEVKFLEEVKGRLNNFFSKCSRSLRFRMHIVGCCTIRLL